MTLAFAVALIIAAELVLTVGVPALDNLDRRLAANVQLFIRRQAAAAIPLRRRMRDELMMRQQRQGQSNYPRIAKRAAR